jgi:pyridoxamine 5'-phosphate oxidase
MPIADEPGAEPFETLTRWYATASQTEPRVPDAMQLATVSPQGQPSIRTVLLKAFGPQEGLVFYTNYNSQKSRELDATPRAAICLHWKDIARQVIANGRIERLSEDASKRYFASRDRGSQVAAWASQQSEQLTTRQELLERVEQLEQRFDGKPVPCPPHWGGYRLIPERMEFWQDVPNRLHHRVVFEREHTGWRRLLLQP